MDREKRQNMERSDAKRRNDEMIEGKSPDEVAEIYKKGEKYYCAECHSEVPIMKSCPKCQTVIDWDRVFLETRR